MTFKNVESARGALRCVPGNRIHDFWGMPLTGESAPAVAAAKILHKQAPGLAAANRLPQPGELPRRFRVRPWHFGRGPRKRVARAVLAVPGGMAGSLWRKEQYWHWPLNSRGEVSELALLPFGGRVDPFQDSLWLPVSRRSFGWALANPQMLAVASGDLLWRAIVIHYLWLLSGRPPGPARGA